MKKLLSVSLTVTALAGFAAVNFSGAAYAEKKCQDGYVWDADSKKCVKKEVRGSYH